MRVVIVACGMFAIATQPLPESGSKPCTVADAIRAEGEAPTLRTWADVHSSYRRFANCDDGAIADGYSGSVARLLSTEWNTMSELHRLIARDKGFGRFLLKHVDELMSACPGGNNPGECKNAVSLGRGTAVQTYRDKS